MSKWQKISPFKGVFECIPDFKEVEHKTVITVEIDDNSHFTEYNFVWNYSENKYYKTDRI